LNTYINKIDKPVTNQMKLRREKAKLTQLEKKKGISRQNSTKSRGLLGNASKTNIQINWKI
jgi:hypothetical protein